MTDLVVVPAHPPMFKHTLSQVAVSAVASKVQSPLTAELLMTPSAKLGKVITTDPPKGRGLDVWKVKVYCESDPVVETLQITPAFMIALGH